MAAILPNSSNMSFRLPVKSITIQILNVEYESSGTKHLLECNTISNIGKTQKIVYFN